MLYLLGFSAFPKLKTTNFLHRRKKREKAEDKSRLWWIISICLSRSSPDLFFISFLAQEADLVRISMVPLPSGPWLGLAKEETLTGDWMDGRKWGHDVYCSSILYEVSLRWSRPYSFQEAFLYTTFSCQVLALFSPLILFGLCTVRVTHPGLLHQLFWFPYMLYTLYN